MLLDAAGQDAKLLLTGARARFRAAALLILCGCAGGDRESGRASEAQGLWKHGEEWQVVRETTLGASDDGSDGFANVVDVEFDPLGRAWVADAGSYQIRIFERDGTPVRTFGRRGGGPADFAAIAGMALSPGGQMWVMDSGNSRYAVYDTAGTLVTTHPRESNMATSPWPGVFDRQGRLYDVAGDIASDGSIETFIVRMRSVGERPDTFRIPPFAGETFDIRRSTPGNRTINQVNVPFTGSQDWAIDPAGSVWVANTGRYRLERHSFDGRIQQTVARRVKPLPVSAAERNRMLEGYEAFRRAGGVIDESRIPDHHPALNNFLFDDREHLWVIPTVAAGQSRVADVFNRDGSFLGRVGLGIPQRSRPKTVRGDQIAVLARDSLDVQNVVLLRIVPPHPAPLRRAGDRGTEAL